MPAGDAYSRLPSMELLRDLAVLVEVLRGEAAGGRGWSQAERDADRLTSLIRRYEVGPPGGLGPFLCPIGCGREYDTPRDAERCLWNYNHREVSEDARRF